MKFLNSRRGGALRGLLVSAGIVMILLLGAIVFFVRGIHIAKSHGDTTKEFSLNLPGGGSFSLNAREHLSPAKLGVPVYPGAIQKTDGGGAAFKWSSGSGDEKEFAVAGADLFTTDSPEKVLAWYREQLPDWILVHDRDGFTRLEMKRGGFTRVVAITTKNDGTHISVASIGKPESN